MYCAENGGPFSVFLYAPITTVTGKTFCNKSGTRLDLCMCGFFYCCCFICGGFIFRKI